jgi:hypothetical protein
MMNRLLPGWMVAAAVLSGAAGAFAAPPESVSPAQALFDRGVIDMEAGRYEKACPAIEASQRMEPMPGTLFALAECESQRGRLATAVRYYNEYLALYRAFNAKKKLEQKDRAATSEAQLKKLDPAVPRLTLALPAGAPADVVVKRDGEVVAELSLGSPLLVNPGDHLITTQVPGGPVMEHRVSLTAAESKTLQLTVRREPFVDTKSTRLPSEALLVPPPPPPDVRPWRIGTWSAGAVAVLGLAVGTVTGILAIQERNVVGDNCNPDGSCPTAVGYEASQRMAALGTASTLGFVTAGVGLAVGITLLVATPTSPTAPQNVGSSPVSGAPWSPFGITATGSF